MPIDSSSAPDKQKSTKISKGVQSKRTLPASKQAAMYALVSETGVLGSFGTDETIPK